MQYRYWKGEGGMSEVIPLYGCRSDRAMTPYMYHMGLIINGTQMQWATEQIITINQH